MADEKTILIAEDEDYLYDSLQFKLSKEGFKLIMAKDGEEAIKELEKNVPDLILLDLIMPKKNGFDVLEYIKSNKKLSKVPVIVLSNLSQDPDIEEAKKLGVKDYFVKSNLTLEEVVGKINQYI